MVLTIVTPVMAEAIALCTPSDESGSMNMPASPTSRKRLEAKCVAVCQVASNALGGIATLAVWSVPLHNGLRNVTLLIDWEVGARIRQSGLQEFYLAELRTDRKLLANNQ